MSDFEQEPTREELQPNWAEVLEKLVVTRLGETTRGHFDLQTAKHVPFPIDNVILTHRQTNPGGEEHASSYEETTIVLKYGRDNCFGAKIERFNGGEPMVSYSVGNVSSWNNLMDLEVPQFGEESARILAEIFGE